MRIAVHRMVSNRGEEAIGEQRGVKRKRGDERNLKKRREEPIRGAVRTGMYERQTSNCDLTSLPHFAMFHVVVQYIHPLVGHFVTIRNRGPIRER